MTYNTGAISSDTIFKILVGSRSGSDAFQGFKLLSSMMIPGTVNCMSGIGVTGSLSISGRSSSGSRVNCDVYWVFRASAFPTVSLMMTWSAFRTSMLLSPAFFCLMLEYTFFGFSVILVFKMLSV